MYVLFNFQTLSQMAGPLVYRVKGSVGGAVVGTGEIGAEEENGRVGRGEESQKNG